jgi:hypothetical protein
MTRSDSDRIARLFSFGQPNIGTLRARLSHQLRTITG